MSIGSSVLINRACLLVFVIDKVSMLCFCFVNSFSIVATVSNIFFTKILSATFYLNHFLSYFLPNKLVFFCFFYFLLLFFFKAILFVSSFSKLVIENIGMPNSFL